MKKRYIILFLFALFAIVAVILVMNTPETMNAPASEIKAPVRGNTLDPQPAPVVKSNMIEVATPSAGSTISSPLVIKGEARGNWFFEGSFPITLTDTAGTVIAQKYATAKGDWMTTENVVFEGTLSFTVPQGVTSGYLILKKDNPSGEARFDDQVEIPVKF